MSEADVTKKRSSSSSEQNILPRTLAKVRLIGVLGSAAGRRELDLEFDRAVTVSELITALLETINNRQFHDLLVDSGTGDPRPNVIILLNEQDCNVFDGLKTRVENGTVVTIIPVAHGGVG